MGFRTTMPAPNTGYNRATDWPVAGGVGAGIKIDGVSAGGGIAGMFGMKSGPATPGSTGTWHPTITWMMGFVIVELIAFNLLSKYLNI